MRLQRGFTLLELMVTLAVAAILFSVAVPGFQQMVQRNRVITYTNDFIATVNYARSEAIRTASPVSICASSDGATCTGTWSQGWITFANRDGDNPAEVDAGGVEPVLKVHERLNGQYTLSSDAVFAGGVTYDVSGAANATGVLAVCHAGSLAQSRAIVLTRLRPRVATDTDGDHIPNIDGGNLVDCASPSGGP
jgi:type IV fimbrial biogenesis protein FimT